MTKVIDVAIFFFIKLPEDDESNSNSTITSAREVEVHYNTPRIQDPNNKSLLSVHRTYPNNLKCSSTHTSNDSVLIEGNSIPMKNVYEIPGPYKQHYQHLGRWDRERMQTTTLFGVSQNEFWQVKSSRQTTEEDAGHRLPREGAAFVKEIAVKKSGGHRRIRKHKRAIVNVFLPSLGK